MEQYEFEGRLYRKNGAKWVDASGMSAPLAISKKLDALAFSALDLSSMDWAEARTEGDRYKEAENYAYAIRFYERAMEAAGNERQISVILPRLTSCYRKHHHPENVIKLMHEVKSIYGARILNEALLTSAAAAYCDMEQPNEALQCCRYAYAMAKENNPKALPGLELTNVWERAKRMAGEDFENF